MTATALSPSFPAVNHKERVVAFGHAEFIQTSGETHQTILQGLNRWMKYDNGEQYFLDAEAFQGTEKAWDKVPVIFAQEHPEDFDLVDNDLEAALSQLKDYEGNPGRICGSLGNTAVLIPGQPRLSSEITLTDPKVKDLYEKGKLSLSTGFTCTPGDDGHLTGKVRPNHVLIFVVDDSSQPRDKAAMLLNMEEGMNANHIGKVISEKNRSRFKQALDVLKTLFSEMTSEEPGLNCNPDDEKRNTTNQAESESVEERGRKLQRAISEKFGTKGIDGEPWGAWIMSTFEKTVVFRDPAEKLQEVPYSVNADGIVTLGEPTEVEVNYSRKVGNMENNDTTASTKEIEAKNAEIANKDAEIKKLADEKVELQNTLAKIEQDRKDAAWAVLKNKIPPGWVDTQEHETEIRKLAESDPFAFGNKLAEFRLNPNTKEQGQQHATNQQNPAIRRGIGLINKEGKWED